VRQSCRTALAQRSSGQASQETFAGTGRGSSGARQPRTAQPPPPAAAGASGGRWLGPYHLCRLQRPSSLRKLCEVEGFSLSRETLRRLLRGAGLGSPQTPRSRSSPAPSAFRPQRRTGATRWLAARLARRPPNSFPRKPRKAEMLKLPLDEHISPDVATGLRRRNRAVEIHCMVDWQDGYFWDRKTPLVCAKLPPRD